MPRRGESQREFPAVGQPVATTRIGVRSVEAKDHLGVLRVLRLDPAEVQCSALAAELADEWVEFVGFSGIGVSRAGQYRKAILDFCTFADRRLGDEARAASLTNPAPDVGLVLAEWERALPSTRAAGSTIPAQLASSLRTLMARRADHDSRRVDPRLLRIVRGELGLAWGASQEVDEFSRRDKKVIVRTAWQQAAVLERRLAQGWELAEQGGHPGEHGWTEIPNLLWGLAKQGVTPKEIASALPAYDKWPDELRACVAGGPSYKRQMKHALLRWLVRQLFPDHFDLHPYRILLVASTGHDSSEFKHLSEDDIEFLPSGVRLALAKQRASRLRYRTFGGPTENNDSTLRTTMLEFTDKPRYEVSAVVRRLLAVTEQVREHASDRTDRVFVTATVTPSFVLHFGPWHPGAPGFQAWLHENDIQVAGRADIRRLRKSTKVEKAIAFSGRVADIANDHHEEVFRGHYAQGTTMRVLSGQVISTAQDHWLTKALEGPTVLTESADVLESPGQADALGLTRQQADQIRRGALDMGLTQCQDPHNSPYGKPGELCPVAPLRCLECHNAWVLPNNLPQLLLFADHLDGLRNRLSPQHFAALWGQSHLNLQAVLAERTPEEKVLARKQIAAGEESLHLPLFAHVEFDS